MKKSAEINIRVKAIADELAKGETTAEIVRQYSAEWNVTGRTIANYIVQAKEIVAARGRQENIIVENVRNEALVLAAKANIMSDIEVEERLCAIINGTFEQEKKIISEDGEKTLRFKPSAYEVVCAADKLWKKRGTYPIDAKPKVESQNVIIQYNLQRPEDIKFIEGLKP